MTISTPVFVIKCKLILHFLIKCHLILHSTTNECMTCLHSWSELSHYCLLLACIHVSQVTGSIPL